MAKIDKIIVCSFLERAIYGGLGALIFLRPFICGRTYPRSNTYFQVGLLLLAMAWVVKAFLMKKKLSIPSPKGTLLLALFVAFCWLSLPFSINKAETFRQVQELSSYLVLFLLILSMAEDRGKLLGLIAFMLISSFVVSSYGIYQYYYGLKATRQFIQANPNMFRWGIELTPELQGRLMSDRIFATFVYPNALAGFLAMIIPLSLGRILSLRGWLWRSWWSFCLLCFLFTLYKTYSRGGWVSLAGGLALFLILYLWRGKGGRPALEGVDEALSPLKSAKGLLLVFSLTFILASSWALAQVGGKPTFEELSSPESMTARFSYWKTAMRMVKDHPILGMGYGTFGSAYPRYMSIGSHESKMAHNNYLQAWAETGTLGFLAFVGLWAFLLMAGFKECINTRSKSLRALKMGIFSALGAFLLHSLVDFDLYIPGIALFAFALLSLFYGLREQSEGESKPSFSPESPKKAVLAMAPLALLLWASLTPFLADKAMVQAREKVKQRDLRAAIPLVQRAITLFPLDGQYDFYLGYIYKALSEQSSDHEENLSRAVEAFQKAVKKEPFSPYNHEQLGMAYWDVATKKGDEAYFSMALEELRLATECFPSEPSFTLSLARAMEALGKAEEARAFFEKAEELKKRKPQKKWD